MGGIGLGPAPPLDFWFCSDNYFVSSSELCQFFFAFVALDLLTGS